MQLDYKRLYKDIYNIWLMKCISGNIGFNQECYKHTFDFKHIEDFAPTVMYPNDDLDIQIAWLDLLIDKGIKLNSNDLLEKFIDCYRFDFSEYGYAKRNYKRGILPPHSGKYNNIFWESMGCPIRAEVWGIIAAGNPELAVKLAHQDGVIDHGGNSVEAEKLIACMVSLGFTDKNLDSVFSKALTYIDNNCAVYKVVNYVRDSLSNGIAKEDIVKELYKKYAKPDGTSIIINIGFFTLGLYTGGSDFDKVMTNTLNCGYDTDCTCASAGSIYGLLYGTEFVDKKWIDLAGENLVTACVNIHNDLSTFTKLTDESMKIISANNTVSGDNIIVNQNISLEPDVDFIYDYVDGYELKDDKVNIKITIKNNTCNDLSSALDFVVPDNIKFNCDCDKLVVNKGQQKTLSVSVENNDKVFSCDKNIITISFAGYKSNFGIVGSQAFSIVGPFFEGFDYSAIDDIESLSEDRVRVWGGKKYLFHMDCNEYTNNWVRYDYQYIDEDFSTNFEKYFEQGERYYTTEDYIKLDEHYSVDGPMVAYALQKVYTDTERVVEFHIGSSDPYKLWLNGVEIASQKDNWYFSPYNQRPRALLKKGENQIVIKLVRKGESNKFAYVLRDEPYNHVGAIATDLKFVKR